MPEEGVTLKLYKGWLMELYSEADGLWRRVYVSSVTGGGMNVQRRDGSETFVTIKDDVANGYCRLLYRL